MGKRTQQPWKGKVVLVTGGSAGLGLAIASKFAEQGARVIIVARGQEQLDSAAASLRARGAEVTSFSADITQQEQVDRLFTRVIQSHGQLDVLVNNAGRSSRGEALQTTPDEFRELFEVNFLSLVRCTRAAAGHLIHSKGHLVNIGSLASKTASPHLGAYPVSKFPVAAYSQQLRLELGPRGVHVLLVCPGPIARADSGRRYQDQARDLPSSARQPGGGVKLKGISAEQLAQRILDGCRRRQAEIVMPSRARLLFAIGQLFPSLGDWIINKMMR